MDPYRGEEVGPGLKVKTDDEIDGWLKKVVITAHHPAAPAPSAPTPCSIPI